jgi:hypothetical protein
VAGLGQPNRQQNGGIIMAFKVKDLMIQVVPADSAIARGPALGCGIYTTCTYGSCTCTASYLPPPDLRGNAGDTLALLRAQLAG